MRISGRRMAQHDSFMLERINFLIKVALTMQKHLQYL